MSSYRLIEFFTCSVMVFSRTWNFALQTAIQFMSMSKHGLNRSKKGRVRCIFPASYPAIIGTEKHEDHRNPEMRTRPTASLPIEWKGNLMTFTKNEFGVPQYPDGDARRLFVLLAAIDLLERPTISAIADLTSHHRDTIATDIAVLHEQYGVTLHKLGDVYRIESWGDVLKKQGVKKFLKAQFN